MFGIHHCHHAGKTWQSLEIPHRERLHKNNAGWQTAHARGAGQTNVPVAPLILLQSPVNSRLVGSQCNVFHTNCDNVSQSRS